MNDTSKLYRLLPSLDKVLRREEISSLIDELGAALVKRVARDLLTELRSQLANGADGIADKVTASDFIDDFCNELITRSTINASSSLRPVLNLTGTVVHTNLGRSVLPVEAISAIASVGQGACNLEFDLMRGKRGDRDSHLESLLCEICGAEAVTVVNNNAAAVLLALNTFAAGKSVLISRGELVEIGGSFRIPDVMRSANAVLREVGTTNRTHLHDYSAAIDEHTGLLLKVHTSNYAVKGFTASVTEAELANLAQQKNLVSMADLGSGTLVDLNALGLPAEPTVQSILNSGVDIVTFSGDKLLGGPQSGIIAGKKELIERIKRNPLKRALRVGKLTIAALEAVLQLYRDPDRLPERLPLLRDLTRSSTEIRQLAESLLPAVKKLLNGGFSVRVIETQSQIGSGALPMDLLPSAALEVTPVAGTQGADEALVNLAARLRSLSMPVIGRIHDGSLILDLRCLREEALLVDLLSELPAVAHPQDQERTR